MPTLRPFRDYAEKDVINLYSWSGTVPANRGTLCKIVQGFKVTDEPIEMLGPIASSYNNTVSQRYGAYAKIAACDAGNAALGILLMDVREVDENGEQLKFNPRKAAEMDCVLSGQAVPVVRRGMFLYSGSVLAAQTPVAHTKLYAGAAGEITTGNVSSSSTSVVITGVTTSKAVVVTGVDASGVTFSGNVDVGLEPYSGQATVAGDVTSPCVGYCLGPKDTHGCVLIYLNIA